MICVGRRTGILVLAIVTFAALPAAQERSTGKRGITEKDIFSFVWVADPQMAPDGRQVAFVRVEVDEAGDQYKTAIWVAAADGSEPPRPFTSGPNDTAPRWSPDNRHLAFVRSAEESGRRQPPQIYLMATAGGEPRAITNVPRGAGNPEWSPDGTTIAFSSSATPEEAERAVQEEEKSKPAKRNERVSDVKVITEAVYRANGVPGSGYVDREHPSHIWTVAVPAPGEEPGQPRRLTSGRFPASNFGWSKDGNSIYFVSDRREEPYYLPSDSDLYEVHRAGGEPRLITSIDGTIGSWAESPDGKRLAFIGRLHGQPERSYSQPDLFVSDLSGSTPRNLTASYDFDIGGSIGGDQRAPRGAHPADPLWTSDGRSIIVRAGEQGDANLKRIDAATGNIAALTSGHQEVMSYTADDRAARLAVVLSTQTVLGDLYAVDVASGASKRLTSFNDELFAKLELSEPEEIWYASFDGKKIQGWILKPPSFDPSRRHPMILQIHGGPHSAYGHTFTHEFQVMAARGYVVLFTNPRGSSNYGQEFGNSIQFAYPGDDYKDLMAGVDTVVNRGYVDTARMGVTGGSGGGLLTNWVVCQTTRFKAAVSQRDISDWSNFWYTADFTLFRPTWFRKAPFEDAGDFVRRSPITHVEKIQTPLLFILGDEDWRTPPSAGGEPLFRALKYLKRPTAMVRFPGENHELSRSGKPWHRVERLQHIIGWFDRWLLGKEPGTYGQSS
ncbi:MAG: prolyl oligopeptidase family serine peptidase [Vicinamibacterales bacterium]